MPVNEKQTIIALPCMALRNLVAFPEMVLTVDVGRKKSIQALSRAMDTDSLIYLVTQKDVTVEEPRAEDLYDTGCVCRVRQVIKLPDGRIRAMVQGLYRASHASFVDNKSHFVCRIEKLLEKPSRSREVYKESMLRKIRDEFEKYIQVNEKIASDILMTVGTSEDIGFLCDFIAFNIPAPFDDKQYILEQLNIISRAKAVLQLLSKEREICEIDNRIGQKTRFNLDENQKEYYLREQIKVINEELYGDDRADEIGEYYERLEKLNADDFVKEKIQTEINKLSKMPPGSHEGTVSRIYLDLCLDLPWNTLTQAKVDINKAQKILERDFYGLEKVKERILEMLSVFALSPDIKGQIICLAGPPGVGKTSVGKTIAECMGRKYARVSLGGMHDEAEIRGHRKTYIGAMPGRIINAIKASGSSNPLILLDEIDKLSSDHKGDPASALLEVLDPEQNCKFTDNFLDMPYDLSRVVFITTANSIHTIPPALLDRMEIISLDSYTREEKFNIAKRHLVSREIKSHALSASNCRITDGALYGIIDHYTREAGVRQLSRVIGSLCGKAAKQIASGEAKRVTVKESDLEEMLGVKKFRSERILSEDQVGIINGLAWTQVGGEIMQMEVLALKGDGKIVLTGNLGDVMQESAKAAITYVRANAEKYGIDTEFYKNTDIHIHATESAVSKDGPSAGVTIATALVSALTGREVKRDIAMTGEITIKGRVLAIGGLKEKAMAAYSGGVKKVFIPKDNVPNIEEIDQKVRENITIIPVSRVEEIIDAALVSISGEEGSVKSDFCPTQEPRTSISQ